MKRAFSSAAVITAISLSVLAGCTAVIRTPPPAARIEVRPAPPFVGAIWIDGHWLHRHGEWVWSPGYWIKRPGPRARWIPGHWVKRPWGWKRVHGRWRY
jgi:hypothetical protein